MQVRKNALKRPVGGPRLGHASNCSLLPELHVNVTIASPSLYCVGFGRCMKPGLGSCGCRPGWGQLPWYPHQPWLGVVWHELWGGRCCSLTLAMVKEAGVDQGDLHGRNGSQELLPRSPLCSGRLSLVRVQGRMPPLTRRIPLSGTGLLLECCSWNAVRGARLMVESTPATTGMPLVRSGMDARCCSQEIYISSLEGQWTELYWLGCGSLLPRGGVRGPDL